MVGTESSVEEMERLRHEMGLDRPLVVQYVRWLSNILQGEFGTSMRRHEKVINMIGRSAPPSFLLVGLSLILGTLVGILAGIISAIRRGRFIDSLVTVLSNLGVAMPIFWLGILFIYFFGLELDLLPIAGYTSPLDDLWLSIRKLIMPVICLSVYPMAFLARQTRSSILEVIHQDYIRTAWAKGLKERVIILRHGLKNALIPIITMLGVLVASMAGGAVLTETIFNIPGMGRLIVRGVLDNEYLLVQGCILIIALLVAFINLLVDISYAWLDPRIRL